MEIKFSIMKVHNRHIELHLKNINLLLESILYLEKYFSINMKGITSSLWLYMGIMHAISLHVLLIKVLILNKNYI